MLRVFAAIVIVSAGADQAELDALAKQLKATTAAERIKACAAIGKLGAEAKPLTRALCQAALDPATQKAALEALSKVDADLFPPVATLLIDKTPEAKVAVLGGAFVKLKEKSLPALPVIYSAALPHLQGKEDAKVCMAVLTYVLQVTPDDPLTVTFLAECLKAKSPEAPAKVMDVIHELAVRKVLRKELVPLVQAQFLNKDPLLRAGAALAAGAFGPEGKPLLPTLNKLQLDANAMVRSAAQSSILKIQAK